MTTDPDLVLEDLELNLYDDLYTEPLLHLDPTPLVYPGMLAVPGARAVASRPPTREERRADKRARKNAARREQRKAIRELDGATRWPALRRDAPPDRQDQFAAALALAKSIDIWPADPPAETGLPPMRALNLPGPRREREGRGGATASVVVMRYVIRCPLLRVLAAVTDMSTGMGRPGQPEVFWFFYLLIAREFRSLEKADQEIREHWDTVVVPEFAALGYTLRVSSGRDGSVMYPSYRGFHKWRIAKVQAAELLDALNHVFTVFSLRLHVACANRRGLKPGTLLGPAPWQIPFSDSTVFAGPSDVTMQCAVCGPDVAVADCPHGALMQQPQGSRRKTGRPRPDELARDYTATKAYGRATGFHNIAVGATSAPLYGRVVLAVDVDADRRDEMEVSMPLMAHVLELAGPDWVRGLAYDGLLMGCHHLDLLRRYGVPVINMPSVGSLTAVAESDAEVLAHTVRLHGKHKGETIRAYVSAQGQLSHQNDAGAPCHHFLISRDGGLYASRAPIDRCRPADLGDVLTPTSMTRDLTDNGTYQVFLGFGVRCGLQVLPVEFELTDSKVNADGNVPFDQPIQAVRHFCDADVKRWEGTGGIRSNIESQFSWLQQCYYHTDRMAAWGRDARLLDLLAAAGLNNAEVWAHAALL